MYHKTADNHGRAGRAQWLEGRTRGGKVAGSSPGRSGGRIFFSSGRVRVRAFVCAHVRVYDCVCNVGLACLASLIRLERSGSARKQRIAL